MAISSRKSSGETGWRPHIHPKLLETIRGYAILLFIGVFLITPFYWMIATSLKTTNQLFDIPPSWIPNPIAWENYARVFKQIPFHLFIRNSFVLAFWNIIGRVFSCTLVAYGFSRFRFPGRTVLFLVLLGTLMVPSTVTLVPRYFLFAKLKMINTYWPLILPSFGGNAYLIFLMRQYMMTIPMEIDEAALLDGANRWQILRHIIAPLCMPAIVLVIVFTFVWVWNDFMDPLIFINDMEKFPVSVGLSYFRSTNFTSWELLTAGSMMALLPPAILFLIFQRKLIGGISVTGTKG
jgi:multiple sugar transport system permease protein